MLWFLMFMISDFIKLQALRESGAAVCCPIKLLLFFNFSLPLSAASRILNTHNFPCLLVKLVEQPPWTQREKGLVKKFIGKPV